MSSHSEAAEDLGLEPGSSGPLQGAVGLTYHHHGVEIGQELWRGAPWKHSELLGSG